MPRLPRTRLTASLALGALAGVGLGLAVLPLGLRAAGYGNFAALAYFLRPLVWLAAVVMAAGGLGVARARHAVEAVKAFSLSGLIAGAGLAALGLEAAAPLVAVGGLTGWLYGLAAGLVAVPLLAPRGTRAAAPAPAGLPADPVALPAAATGAGDRGGLDGDAI